MDFTEPIYRPPFEAKSLLVRATQSCTHNKCFFCYTSRGHDFRAATPEEMARELAEKRPFFPPNTRVYMVGPNPLALPFASLKALIETLRAYFPDFAELSMQAMIRDVRGKNMGELKALRSLGLRHLYIGTESGNDETLGLMNKGHTAEEAVTQLLRLDEAGIEYTTQYILGMAGHGKGRENALASATFFNRVHPRRITTTGLTVFPGTPLHAMTQSGQFTEATEKEKVEELLLFLEHLTNDCLFDSRHVLNPVRDHYDTPQEKAEVLAYLRAYLVEHSEADIERMVNRPLMASL